MISDQDLIERARAVLQPRRLSSTAEAGSVGAALVTDRGTVFVGVCLDLACSIGFCAEHTAIAQMVTHGENRIAAIVAVHGDGKLLPPCGRCREMIAQVHPDNQHTRVLLASRTARLSELLPDTWGTQT